MFKSALILSFDALMLILLNFFNSKLSTIPPASFISKVPAAMSQRLTFFCKHPSNLPEDTYAKSSAALPVFLIKKFSGRLFLKLTPYKQS